MKSRVKTIYWLSAAVGFLLLGAGVYVGNGLYTLALVPGSNKSDVFLAPHNQSRTSPSGDSGSIKDTSFQTWLQEIRIEDRFLTSGDGLALHAAMVKNESDAHTWVILCHGYTSEGRAMLKVGMHFYENGYHLLMPDSRGSGQSEGDYIGMGWHDRLDMISWIDAILTEHPEDQIILYGVSMGAATVMMTAGEELPLQVKVVVEDCGYTSVWDEFAYQLDHIFGLPQFPVMHFASLVTKLRAGYFLGEGDCVRQVAKSRLPILFIHGDSDTFVPSEMVDRLYEAAGGPREKLIVKGAGHGEASRVLGAEYWRTVDRFVSEHLDDRTE